MAWPFDSEEQLDAWADDYLLAHQTTPHTTDAHEAAHLASEPGYSALHLGHAETLWRFVLKVLERQPSERALGMLAAGPIEDLISECGTQFIDRIETQARQDPLFREALHGVWQSTTPDALWARIVRARGADPSSSC